MQQNQDPIPATGILDNKNRADTIQHGDGSTLPHPTKVKYDNSRKQLTLQYHGKKSVKMEHGPVPIVTDPEDVIVKVTATTVCGSDLHIYHGELPLTKKGDVLGHESVGIVDEVGPAVKSLKKGDRVVITAVISCGKCEYCVRGEMSCCDVTNPSKAQEKLYGHHTGALFGYTHMLGGYDGGQAEYIRVPYADTNCFKIPDDIKDEQALMLADIACTSWHGTELAEVRENDVVAVFGCGPVGLETQMWSKARGAKRVIAVDVDQSRLDFAKAKLGVETINAKTHNVVDEFQKLVPGGPDKVIECVGFRFPTGIIDKIERAVYLETDSANVVNDCIKVVRKNGVIVLIGDYVGFTNHFNIGAFMEKHLTMRGGQLWPHRYIPKLFQLMQSGKADPTFVITHTMPFSKCAEVYERMDKHTDGTIKVVLKTNM